MIIKLKDWLEMSYVVCLSIPSMIMILKFVGTVFEPVIKFQNYEYIHKELTMTRAYISTFISQAMVTHALISLWSRLIKVQYNVYKSL